MLLGLATMKHGLLSTAISSKLFWACALVLSVSLGAALFVYGGDVVAKFESTRYSVVDALGLGIVPLFLWVAALLALAIWKRAWLRPFNIWIGSIAYLAVAFAVLSYFHPEEGPLAAFVTDFDASLGGTVGDAIAGETAWLGGLRAFALFAVGTAIAGPSVSLEAMKLLGKASVLVYVAFMMAGGGIYSLFRRMYKSENKAETDASPDRHRESEALREALETQQAAVRAPSLRYAGRGSVADEPAGSLQPDTPTLDPLHSEPDTVSQEPALTPMYSAEDDYATAAAQQPAMAGVSGADDEYAAAAAQEPAVVQSHAAEDEHAAVVVSELQQKIDEPREAVLAQQTVTVAEPPGSASHDSARDEPADVPEADSPTSDRIRTEPALETQEPSSAPTSSARYNRFWNRSAPPPPPQNGHSVGPVESTIVETSEPDPEPVKPDPQGSWDLPDRSMVRNEDEAGISEEEMSRTSETIRRTLAEYNIEVEIGQMKPGPAVTMYGLIPGWIRRYKQVRATDANGRPKLDEAGKPIVNKVESKTRVKVDSIISREKDLSLALKTPSIRIETPVLGESLVGIEVPNPNLSVVTLGRLMESPEYKKMSAKAKLPIILGKGTGGEPVVVDLAAMPHLLVAGATGSGKSVCLNAIVSCLLMEKSPAEMRLLMVDPKRVELTPYNGIPHLITPVVVESDQVVGLLKGLIREMLNRYRQMEEVGARNIESYNRRQPDKMSYIVLAVDELADLMMTSSFEVEQALCRLAQLGRATGIHLIIATQRPSVDVVTGLIKANFPTRISFGVSSQIDSRTILDSVGAEKLLGRGDMLYLAVDASRPKRVQGVFISDEECEDIVDFWQATPRGSMSAVSLHAVGDGDEPDEKDKDANSDRDEFLQKAIDLAQHHKKLSTSLLQRRLRIGYPRAARLMDQLEDEGVVGPGDGSKSRDVIMNEA